MRTDLEVHVLQLTSVDSIDQNWQQIRQLLSGLGMGQGNTLICLPENSLYLRTIEGEKVPGIDFSHSVWSEIQTCARSKNWNLHFGSVPFREQSKLANMSVMVWSDGRLEKSYQKIHLFDIELEGEKPIRESDVYSHGDHPRVLPIKDWNVGQSICYDIRFSELYHQYALQGVEVILIPASFLVPTGKVHWEVLLRARAIESQAYVVAAAQAGIHLSTKGSGQRETFGHSMVIDPWGNILAKGTADKAEVLSVVLKKDEIGKVRRQIPMAGHRRLHKMSRN